MNLSEFAELTGRAEEELKQILLEKKSVKIFSSQFPLSETLVEFLKQYIDFHQDDSIAENVPEKEQALAKDDGDSEQKQELAEIRDILFANSSKNLLERCVKNAYHVIVDTSSIMWKNNAFRKFYRECRPLLEHYDRKLEIPYSVMVELSKNSLSTHKEVEAISLAEKGIELLKGEIGSGRVLVLGDRNDTCKDKRGKEGYFADASLIVQILAWRNNGESVLFITQDRTMALDVMKITDVQSVKSSAEIIVRKLDAYGSLTEVF